MTPIMQLLDRRINRASAITPKAPPSGDDSVGKILLRQVQAAEDKLLKAENDNAALVVQLSESNKEWAQRHKELLHKIDDVKDAAKQELDARRSKHSTDLEEMQSQIDALRMQVAAECQDKIRAQTQLEAAQANCAKLEQQIAKLQSVKPAPVVAPKTPPLVLPKYKVTQRDENGNIVIIERIA